LLNGYIIARNNLELELLIQLEAWLIEWHFGLKEIGRFKMKQILTLILLLLLEQLDLFYVRFGNGIKAAKQIEI
jgi:hypothetical protein